MNKRKFCILALSTGGIFALAGCAGPRPLMPAPYTLSISASTELNLDRRRRATPVQVGLFELRSSTGFETIDFYSLFDKGPAALGSDMLRSEQLTLQPGQNLTLTRKAEVGARMLGVFVAFRDLERSSWRAVARLPQAQEVGRFAVFSPSFDRTLVTVHVGANHVTANTSGSGVAALIPGTGGLSPVDAPSAPGPGTGGSPAPRVLFPGAN